MTYSVLFILSFLSAARAANDWTKVNIRTVFFMVFEFTAFFPKALRLWCLFL
jgi:hypothetical protein